MSMSQCPRCGSKDAYIGAYTVECVNSDCVHFSEKQYNLILDEQLKLSRKKRNADTEPEELDKEENNITPLMGWNLGHPFFFVDYIDINIVLSDDD